MGVSLLAFYANIAHFKLGLTTVILAHITFCIAFVVVVVNARLASFDNRLVEAAADLGATPFQTFLRIVLPLAAPGHRGGRHARVHDLARRRRDHVLHVGPRIDDAAALHLQLS